MTDEELQQRITSVVSAFAAEKGYVLSPAKDAILGDMVNMYKKYGDFYCPCQIDNNEDTICVCSAVRGGMVDADGACFCYLFLKPE